MTVVTPSDIAKAIGMHQIQAKVMPIAPVSDQSAVQDEIVDKIVGNNKGRAREKKACKVCGRKISPNNLARHMETHSDKPRKPYPRTACRYCDELVPNNNIARHEESCDKRRPELEMVLNVVIEAMGGITPANVDDFLAVREVLGRVIKT